MGPTWPENRSPGALESALGSKLVSRAVWGPFSAFFSLGKPCRNAWQEVRVACFECICLCSLDRCQKTLLPLGSLFFARFLASSLRGFVRLVTHFSGCFVELCRVVRKSSQLGPKLGPKSAQVGPNISPSSLQVGPSWPLLAEVGPNLAHLGPSCPQVRPGCVQRVAPRRRANPRTPKPHTLLLYRYLSIYLSIYIYILTCCPSPY